VSGIRLDSVETAIAAIKDGRPVVVLDDEDRENEGDLIFASELATPELVAFMVRYTSGYICVAVTEADADRLDLPPMFRVNQDRRGTAYTVTVDAREGVTTGISAQDRSNTIRALIDPKATPADFLRPGHTFPLRARDGGVLEARHGLYRSHDGGAHWQRRSSPAGLQPDRIRSVATIWYGRMASNIRSLVRTQ